MDCDKEEKQNMKQGDDDNRPVHAQSTETNKNRGSKKKLDTLDNGSSIHMEDNL